MSNENFIRDALYKPNDYIAYHVGRELKELHPGKDNFRRAETGTLTWMASCAPRNAR